MQAVRVLYLTDRLSRKGGADLHLRQVVDGAVSDGHEVTVVYGRSEGDLSLSAAGKVVRIKGLASAVASAKERFGAEAPQLYVKSAFADEGPTLRRFRPRAMGRATRINKRTAHVTVVVAERD